MTPDAYEVTLAVIGFAAVAAALLTRFLDNKPMSPLLVLVGLGAAVFALPLGITLPDPDANSQVLERLTEFGVLVALMGAGLKIDRPFSWRTWSTTWRLLAVTMPLTIAASAVLGSWMLGLPIATAALLGSVLAPTDPVLAGDVQVGEPGGPEEDEVRFALTSEAGLNDALAFPFVYAALAMAQHGAAPMGWFGEWLAIDVVVRLGVGAVVGLVFGRLLGLVLFRLRAGREDVAESAEGFVAIASMLLVYGASETLNGYGFLSVFIAASALRASERDHEYHRVLHGFVEQLERILTAGLLVLFGGLLAQGLLRDLDWRAFAFAAVVLLAIRPAAGLLAMHGSATPRAERTAIAIYGVRGVGSFYYLAYALSEKRFAQGEELWPTVAVVVLGSLVFHGTTAGPVMAALDRRRSSRLRHPRRSNRGTISSSAVREGDPG